MKRFTKNAATAFGALLVSILLAEMGLRAARVEFPIFRTVDPITGTANIPNASGWYRNEGRAYIKMNAQGQRDRDHEIKKLPNTVRIAVLGDSFSTALQVGLECTFWSVMERELKATVAYGSKEVEVINFGVDGYGTAQEFLTLHHKVWKYSPDLVLLAFLTGNDIADNHRKLKRVDYVPYFVYHGDDLVLDRSFLESAGYRARSGSVSKALVAASRRSRIVQLINRARLNFKYEKSRMIEEKNGVETGLAPSIYSKPSDPAWREAWRVTEGILLLMAEEVRQRGAHLLVVTLTNGSQVHPDPQRREATKRRLGVSDLLYPDRRIKAFCERNRIPVLSLAPHFQQFSDQTGIFLHGFDDHLGSGHWNENGHQLAGELIARKIREELWSSLLD